VSAVLLVVWVVYSPVTLNLSSSSGSGGKLGASRTVLVDSLAPSEITASLQQLLDISDQSSALLTIPASSINKKFAYSFTVKQWNFLGRCGQSAKRVLALSSTIPTVTLPGSPLRTVKRSASLSISSEAFFVPCGGSATRALVDLLLVAGRGWRAGSELHLRL